MERSTLDLWVGLFVCAGIGALMILAMKVGNMASIGIGNQTYTLYAHFDNIGGLKPRAPVKRASSSRSTIITSFRRTPPLRYSLRACWANSTSASTQEAIRPISPVARRSSSRSLRWFWRS
jgi:hypothetical protein